MIGSGHKFALLALPIRNLADALGATRLTDGLELMRKPPLAVPEQWRRWIGELGEKAVSDAAAYLLLSRPSVRPDVLDGENQELMQAICHFWDALLIVETPYCGDPQLLSGANVNGEIKVRSLQKLRTPARYAYSQTAVVRLLDENDFKRAGAIYERLCTLVQCKDYRRLKWAMSAFFDGIHESRHDRRLHQFCRCIDGIICSRKGSGKRDFEARTALFIGAGHEGITGEIYLMRSAVEHLRPATTEAAGCVNEKSRRTRVVERSVQAEAIARCCLARILLSDALLACYVTDDAIAAFWNLGQADREKAWGSALNFDAEISGAFDSTLISDRELQ